MKRTPKQTIRLLEQINNERLEESIKGSLTHSFCEGYGLALKHVKERL